MAVSGMTTWMKKDSEKENPGYSFEKSLPRNRNAPGLLVSFIVCQSPRINLLESSDKEPLLQPLPQTLAGEPQSPLFPLENKLLDKIERIIWGPI